MHSRNLNVKYVMNVNDQVLVKATAVRGNKTSPLESDTQTSTGSLERLVTREAISCSQAVAMFLSAGFH